MRYLEAAAPDYKFGLNLGYSTPKFNIQSTLTQFSEVQLQDFQWVDTPATTQAEADALYPVATDIYEAALVVDLSAGYQFYCGKDLEDAHSAEADTLATYEILKAQLDKYDDLENSIESLVNFLPKPNVQTLLVLFCLMMTNKRFFLLVNTKEER